MLKNQKNFVSICIPTYNNPIGLSRLLSSILEQDYKNLEAFDTINMQRGIWYLMSPKIIHSVENVMGARTAITVSVPDMDQFPWKNRVPVE